MVFFQEFRNHIQSFVLFFPRPGLGPSWNRVFCCLQFVVLSNVAFCSIRAHYCLAPSLLSRPRDPSGHPRNRSIRGIFYCTSFDCVYVHSGGLSRYFPHPSGGVGNDQSSITCQNSFPASDSCDGNPWGSVERRGGGWDFLNGRGGRWIFFQKMSCLIESLLFQPHDSICETVG